MQVTDWADGYLARKLGHTSVLGSYLDPLGDKILIGALVGALGWQGVIPPWLVVVVLGRDVGLIGGMMWYRWRMFGGKWPGFRAFMDVDGTINLAGDDGNKGVDVSNVGGDEVKRERLVDGEVYVTLEKTTAKPQLRQEGVEQQGLPAMKPLMVSKLNTVLVLLLIAGCMTQQWQGWPGKEVLNVLEAGTAGTTAASGLLYARMHAAGRLLPPMSGQSKP